METLQCRNCGSTDVNVSPGGVVTCRACDSSFIIDIPQNLVGENEVTTLYGLARNARQAGLRDEMTKYYGRILEFPNHKYDWEPIFYNALAAEVDQAEVKSTVYRGYLPKALNSLLYLLNQPEVDDATRKTILTEMAEEAANTYKTIASEIVKYYMGLVGDQRKAYRSSMIEVETKMAETIFNFGNSIADISPQLASGSDAPALLLWRTGVEIISGFATLGLTKKESRRVIPLAQEYIARVQQFRPSFNPPLSNATLKSCNFIAIGFVCWAFLAIIFKGFGWLTIIFLVLAIIAWKWRRI